MAVGLWYLTAGVQQMLPKPERTGSGQGPARRPPCRNERNAEGSKVTAGSAYADPTDDDLDVLLVEDNPGDVRLTLEAFRDVNRSVQLHVAGDGVEAMSFLLRTGANELAPRPALILLDLNLPRMDGREVLARIKADEVLKTIPTVIVTTSDIPGDVLTSYRLQANAYLRKPIELDAFEELISSINDFWLTRVSLPPELN
jgi:CheY-like chemotaxis protein